MTIYKKFSKIPNKLVSWFNKLPNGVKSIYYIHSSLLLGGISIDLSDDGVINSPAIYQAWFVAFVLNCTQYTIVKLKEEISKLEK